MKLSVIIPTYNRLDVLGLCLESLARQEKIDRTEIEVLVYNDGGDEQAGAICEEIASQDNWGYEWRYQHCEHQGPSALRNLATREAQGDWVLYLNDDVTLSDQHLHQHLTFQQQVASHPNIPQHNGAPLAAAKGMTRWAPDSITTPMMRWLVRQSFFYYLITDPTNIGYEYYHTCDLSIPRKLVTDLAPFNEVFPFPGWEDTEWGWRLENAGLKLHLLPNAETLHHHVYSEENLWRRCYTNGRCAAMFVPLVPELRGRAIDDFIREEEIPGGFHPGWKKHAYRALWNLKKLLKGTPNLDGSDNSWNLHQQALDYWESSPLPEKDTVDFWAEKTRREHVRGFLEESIRMNGVPYPWQ
jgi:glycosyltransferase involved in cell wall biosynthesis